MTHDEMETFLILKYGSAENVFNTWISNIDKFTDEERAFVASNVILFTGWQSQE